MIDQLVDEVYNNIHVRQRKHATEEQMSTLSKLHLTRANSKFWRHNHLLELVPSVEEHKIAKETRDVHEKLRASLKA